MQLTEAQMTTLAAALRAAPELASVLALGDMDSVAAWCNSASTQDAWREDVSGQDLFEQTDVTKFDTLTAGKRDAWRLMLQYAPVDFGRQKYRKAVLDTWGAADSVAILQALTRKATNAEKALGGTDATTNTVTAWKLNYYGTVGPMDAAVALNRNP